MPLSRKIILIVKKIRTPLFVLIISNSGLCQEIQQVQQSRLSYGITFSGTTNYRYLKSVDSESWLRDERNDNETFRLSFTAGFILNYRLTDRFSINSGIGYSDLGFKTKNENLYWPDDNSITHSHIDFHYKYINIPLDLKYSFHDNNKWIFFVAGGVSPNIFIQSVKVLQYEDANGLHKSKDKQGTGFNRVNFAADIQFGADYSLGKKFKITGDIFYKQFLGATNSNLPTKEFLNSAGISFGIMYTPSKRTP